MASFDDLKLTKLLYKIREDIQKLFEEKDQNKFEIPPDIIGGGDIPPDSGAALTILEADGSPSVGGVQSIFVPNGSLTDEGDGVVTLTFGGGGGTPGGSDTQIQYNNAGAFGGITNFTFSGTVLTAGGGTININLTTSLTFRTPDIASGTNSDANDINLDAGDNASSSGFNRAGDVTINGGRATANYNYGGSVYLIGGNSTVGQYSYAGSVDITAGTTNVQDSYKDGGSIGISAGHSGDFFINGFATYRRGSGYGGNVYINAGDTGTGVPGHIILNPGTTVNGYSTPVRGFSALRYNVVLCHDSGSFGSGVGVIYIRNRTTAPTSNPSTGGILYADSGALKWRGSAGTTTTIANA